MRRLECVHCSHSIEEEIVVCTSLSDTHHSYYILCKVKVLWISLISWSEESDEVVAACNLACDEETLDILDCLCNASCLNIILRLGLAKILHCILIDIDYFLSLNSIRLILVYRCVKLEKEDVRSCLSLCLSYNLSETCKKFCRITLHIVVHIKSLVVKRADRILWPVLYSLIVNHHKRVDELILVSCILCVCLNESADECCTIRKE